MGEYSFLKHEIERIVSDVWRISPAMQIKPIEKPRWAEGNRCVEIETTGEWQGKLLLELDSELADAIARYMYGLQRQDALQPQQVEDATKEMVNVLGGNLKSVLPFECQLGIPRLENASQASAGFTRFLEVPFDSEGKCLCLSILKKS